MFSAVKGLQIFRVCLLFLKHKYANLAILLIEARWHSGLRPGIVRSLRIPDLASYTARLLIN